MDSSVHPESKNQSPIYGVQDEAAAQESSIVPNGVMCLRRVILNFKKLLKGTEPKSRTNIQSDYIKQLKKTPQKRTDLTKQIVYLILAGIFLLAIGVWAHLERDRFSYEDVKSVFDFITDISILSIVIGCLIFLLGFCGCLGALRENTCLIKVYYITLCIIFLGQVGGAVYIFLKSNEFKDMFIKTLKEELIPLYTERTDKKTLVDWIQEQLGCCGMSSEGYKDWNHNEYYNCTKGNKSPLACAVPHSCCVKQDTIYDGVPNILCGTHALDEKKSGSTDNIYVVGCVSTVMRVVESNLPVVGGIIIGFALPQILGIVLARTLDGQISDQLARWRRYNQR